MMTLPTLANWEKTAHSLHRAALLLGALRRLLLEPVPNYLELALDIKPVGLSTGQLPFGGEVTLDFQQAALIYTSGAGDSVPVPLAGHNQLSLFELLLATLVKDGQVLAPNTGTQTLTEAYMTALIAKNPALSRKRGDFTDETPLELVPQLAADYAQALYRIFTATARFRARLAGPMTPVVLWPEHFDLSFLWFATDKATESNPHLNFGFAPYSEGLPRPYLYSYAFPLPADFNAPKLPSLARWHTTGWTGVVVSYDELANLADPEAAIEETFTGIYKILSPVLI